MTHVHTFQPADLTSRISYVAIVAVLFAALIYIVVSRGIAGTIDHTAPPTSETTNSADEGSTGATGAPTTDTDTPTDRTVPSPSGGSSNSILDPGRSN